MMSKTVSILRVEVSFEEVPQHLNLRMSIKFFEIQFFINSDKRFDKSLTITSTFDKCFKFLITNNCIKIVSKLYQNFFYLRIFYLNSRYISLYIKNSNNKI